MSRLTLGSASTSKADETFSWMFADAGLAGSEQGFLGSISRGIASKNPLRWHDGTAQTIKDELSAKDGDEARRPIRIKELGQRNFVNVGEVKAFESVVHAVEWLDQNYLNVDPQRLTLAVRLDDDSGLLRMSTDEMVAAGYGGPTAAGQAVGEAAESDPELVGKICAILEGRAIASSVENDGTIPQLKFGSCRWEYEDGDGSWVPYEVDVCKRLSDAEVGERVEVDSESTLAERDRSYPGHRRDEYIEVLRPAHDACAAVDEVSTNRWIWCVTPLSLVLWRPGWRVSVCMLVAWCRSWADDSGPGQSQDLWRDYEPDVCLRLESARAEGKQTIDLDPINHAGERHIDLTDPKNIKQRCAISPRLLALPDQDHEICSGSTDTMRVLLSSLDSVTGTGRWRKVRRVAAKGIQTTTTDLLDDAIAKHDRAGEGPQLNVRCTDHMTLYDAIAWQACLDGDVELLQRALDEQADPNFRGPTYDYSTLLHIACASGFIRCARLLINSGADERTKDRRGKKPFDFLAQQPDQRFMQSLLHDSVSRRDEQQRNDQLKADVSNRARRGAEGGRALVGWILKFAQSSQDAMVINCTVSQGLAGIVSKEVLELAEWNGQRWVQHGQHGQRWVQHGQQRDTNIEFSDDLHYTLVRRATAAELGAAGAHKGLALEEHKAPISVRPCDVDRDLVSKFTTYSFEVRVGNECVFVIKGRYSEFDKVWKRETIAKFPPKHNQNWATFTRSDAVRETAERQRKDQLRKFFEAILDIDNRKGLSNQQKRIVHKKLEMSDSVSARLLAIPEGVPVPGSDPTSIPEQQTCDSDRGVKAELQRRVSEAKRSSELELAADIADAAQATGMQPCVARVRGYGEKLATMEKKKAHAHENCEFWRLHQSMSDALHSAKSHIAKVDATAEDYATARDELEDSMRDPELTKHLSMYQHDTPMCNRWDVELWLKVAKMRRYLKLGTIHKAIEELETPRHDSKICWSLDITGGVGLVEAIQQTFSIMGVAESGTGMLQDRRKEFIHHVDTMANRTKSQVDEINKILSCLNDEVMRLSEFPEAVDDQEPQPEPESDEHTNRGRFASLTALQVEQMRSKYEKFWPKDKVHVTVGKLGDILEQIPGHYRPSDSELQKLDGTDIDTDQFLKICSEQLDAADEELLQVFQIFDTDGDGKISTADLQNVTKHCSEDIFQLSDEVADEMMREGDDDGSGYIEWSQFKKMLRRTDVDCSALEQTIHQITTQWNGERQNIAATLRDAVQAIQAISRFCGYAASAKTAPLFEYTAPGQRSAVNLDSACAGTELLCYIIVAYIISNHDLKVTVSFALPGTVMPGGFAWRGERGLPGECDVGTSLQKLQSLITARANELMAELHRRNTVRVNAAAGEAARISKNMSKALRHFKRAESQATENERSKLEGCIVDCDTELKRQEALKGLHNDAISALSQGNGARTAIAKCAAALRSEEHGTAEHNGMHQMEQLAQSWDRGDTQLAQWQGTEALAQYENAKRLHQCIDDIVPTEGYAGNMIRLGTSALEELKRCIERAKSEIDRKNQYEETKRLATLELDEHRAKGATEKFEKALEIAQTGPESESTDAKEGIHRAQEELKRQMKVKHLFQQAMVVVEKCSPSKDWDSRHYSDFEQLWQEQTKGVELAIDRCNEALRCVLQVQDGGLKCQEDTPERSCLDTMIQCCERWKAGGLHMEKYVGKDAREQFASAQALASRAAACEPTSGYFGAAIRLTPAAAAALKSCIDSSDREIARQKEAAKKGEQSKRKQRDGAANAAVDAAQQKLALAKTPQEKVKAQSDLAQAQQNLQRQEQVKQRHTNAIDSLGHNDPDSALKLYNQALIEAEPDKHLKEFESLTQMKNISQLWIEVKANLQRWDGAAAVEKLKECRTAEQLLESYQPTPGYAGSKITLGLATAELQRCEGYAEAEKQRNSEFHRLIDEGNQSLCDWKAEHALQCFKRAGEHARFTLTYQVTREDVTRPQNQAELDTTAECIERAEAELARQKQVKIALTACVQHLQKNTQDGATVYSAGGSTSPAIKRCATTAIDLAAEACERAIRHCRSVEGKLKSQVTIPEHQALQYMQKLIAAWKEGDAALASWDGEKAESAYRTADQHAHSARKVMLHPTEGYFESSLVKIELTAEAQDALQKCISETSIEIERKKRFNNHIKVGKELLEQRQAVKARDKFAQANADKMNDEEDTEATELLRHATAEQKRQDEAKTFVFQARDLLHTSRDCGNLVKRHTPEEHQQSLEKLQLLYENITENIDAAFKSLRSTEGKLVSQEGTPEFRALEYLSSCVRSWRSADECLLLHKGIDASEAYSNALKFANSAKSIEPTVGYSGEKIELDAAAEDYLNSCVQIATQEIERKNSFDQEIRQGDQCLREDRAAAHLGLTRRSMPSFPATSVVHSVKSSIIYVHAYEKAMSDDERDTVMRKLSSCIDKLEQTLLDERNAYKELVERTLADFDEFAAVEFLFRENYYCNVSSGDIAGLSKESRKCRRNCLPLSLQGPAASLEALHKLASWRMDDSGTELPRITAEKIGAQLQHAINAIEDMQRTNDVIRKLDKEKIIDEGPQVLDTFAEGDEDEDADEDMVQVPQRPMTKLEENVQQRDLQRETTIERGSEYAATASELELQNGEVKQISRELRLGVFGLRRLWRSHDFVCNRNTLLRAWLYAGVSTEWTEEKKHCTQSPRIDGAKSSKTVASCSTENLYFATQRKIGKIFKNEVTVLFRARVCVDGGELTVHTEPDEDDRKNHKEEKGTFVMQLTPESIVEHVSDATVDTRPKALEEEKGKVSIRNAFKVVDKSSCTHFTFIASDDTARRQWYECIERKIDSLKAGAQLKSDLIDPVLEDQIPMVTAQRDCLSGSQQYASKALAQFERWRTSMNHEAPHDQTKVCIANIRKKLDSVQGNSHWMTSPATASQLNASFETLRERIQAERALREIRPADLLRAAMWGMGEQFPQLSAHELIDTSRRYLIAQDRFERSSLQLACVSRTLEPSLVGRNTHTGLLLEPEPETELYPMPATFDSVPSGATYCAPGSSSLERQSSNSRSELRQAQLALATIKDQDLRASVLGLLGDDAEGSFFEFASKASELLVEELRQLEVVEVSARDNNVSMETDGAEQARQQGCPDTSEFERLEELRFGQQEEFQDAVREKERVNNLMERYDRQHRLYPSDERIRAAQENLTRTRRALRATSKLINAQMTVLAAAGSDHWPEVLIRLPKVSEFKQMDFLRSGDLTMHSYECVTPLQSNSRNSVYTAKLDDVDVVLKQYDLTQQDQIQTVIHEVTQLHKMRHPNIVEVNGVFQQIERGKTNMYLQMPRYDGDLLDWLKDPATERFNPRPNAQQRRTILLGVLRAVARVHEFSFTHNDIKLDNVLIDKRGGRLQAVLCDFELLKEQTTQAVDGTMTTVGGTPAYMAPERSTAGHKPDSASDMYSVGVLMLFCFAPDRIEDVTRNAQDPARVKAETVLAQVKTALPEPVRECLDGLLKSNPKSRPSARSFLGTTDAAGNHQDTYFSRAEMQVPIYWGDVPPGSDEQLIEVTDEYTLQALRYAVAPQRPTEFGKGLDAGKYWDPTIPDSDRYVNVVKAWRVQNEPLWKTFSAARERVADDVSRGPSITSNDAPVCNRPKLMKPKQRGIAVGPGCSAGGLRLEEAAKYGFTRQDDAARDDVNETFLLHGIPKHAVADVLQTGLDERYSGANKGTLFGAGSYFAQDIEKADQYNGAVVRQVMLPTLTVVNGPKYGAAGRTEDTASQICKGCTESCTLLEPVITPATCAQFTSQMS
jgi:serine/threonine protein kinase/Ca2+-binding EF-hand superfamily protein